MELLLTLIAFVILLPFLAPLLGLAVWLATFGALFGVPLVLCYLYTPDLLGWLFVAEVVIGFAWIGIHDAKAKRARDAKTTLKFPTHSPNHPRHQSGAR